MNRRGFFSALAGAVGGAAWLATRSGEADGQSAPLTKPIDRVRYRYIGGPGYDFRWEEVPLPTAHDQISRQHRYQTIMAFRGQAQSEHWPDLIRDVR